MILVTGGKGTIGKPLVKRLKDEGHDVLVCDLFMLKEDGYLQCDIQHMEELNELKKHNGIDTVIHLAAEVGRYHGELYGKRCIDNNVAATWNIIKLCLETDSRLLFTSTSEVYGDIGNVLLKENMPGLAPINIYGLSKLHCEDYVNMYNRQYGLKSQILRIFNCYGPGEYPNYFRSIITNFTHKIMNDQEIVVHKNCYRAWCYIDDVVEGFVKSLENFHNGKTYNIGTEEVVSVEYVAKAICDILGKDYSLIKLKERGKFDVQYKRADYGKARRDLKYRAKTRFLDGLRKTVEWHQELEKTSQAECYPRM